MQALRIFMLNFAGENNTYSQKMNIGIVIAMDSELRQIRSLMDNSGETIRRGKTFVTGRIGRNDVVLLQCGIGKVNAAIGTAELIGGFSPEAVISTGVAGGASAELNVCEVVAAAQTCYHDVYCGTEQAYGQVPGLPERFNSDTRLLEKASALCCGTKITTGLTVTGDWFVDSREKMRDIISHFPDAAAVDMESAAIAHTCHLYGVPFMSFRIISDIPLKDTRAEQYYDFWERLADGSFSVTKAFLESL